MKCGLRFDTHFLTHSRNGFTVPSKTDRTEEGRFSHRSSNISFVTVWIEIPLRLPCDRGTHDALVHDALSNTDPGNLSSSILCHRRRIFVIVWKIRRHCRRHFAKFSHDFLSLIVSTLMVTQRCWQSDDVHTWNRSLGYQSKISVTPTVPYATCHFAQSGISVCRVQDLSSL